jgi:hypothetical protein
MMFKTVKTYYSFFFLNYSSSLYLYSTVEVELYYSVGIPHFPPHTTYYYDMYIPSYGLSNQQLDIIFRNMPPYHMDISRDLALPKYNNDHNDHMMVKFHIDWYY